MVFYVVWTVPFLARVTFAVAIQKCITTTVVHRAVIEYLKKQSVDKIFGKWFASAVVTITFLMLILFPLRVQACLLISCLGYQKLFSAMSKSAREMVESIKLPKNYDGMIITFCICMTASTLLMFFSSFQYSLLRFTVPLGFCIPKATKLVALKQE